MASVVLNALWLNRVDTGEAISGPSARDRTTGYGIDGEVRTYASGRRRAITTVGTKAEVARTFVMLTAAQVDTLKSWLGAHVQLRDHRGNKWFGVFFDVTVGEYMPATMYSAQVTLHVTTTVEGV
ncbi:hypothetical protein [Actinoplanes rectilineatus]|uniref:hypothetical protein n=1 Tax=Actinoplanes rectilineatus TaxID=113571 RepID=UPI0005F2D22F|nr:hypothetical protein [Actinoplanes rectilineatus]